jgi:hypothetical protein
VTEIVTGLEPADFLLPTRARAWCVQDLLFHLLLDAQRALVAFASPSDRAPDRDRVSYWEEFRPDVGDGGLAHARFARISASAYSGPEMLVAHWRSTSMAAARAAQREDPEGRIETQGHVLKAADFVDTLVLEAAVHHLDLVLELDAPGPAPEALTLTRGVLEELYGGPLPTVWEDVECVLKATGRLGLDDKDLAALAAGARRLPLLG